MKILGLDYGSKTVGVAISDELGLIASGIETITRDNEVSIKKTIKRLEEIIKENNIKKIVLGYPKNMDGSEGERCEKTTEFKARLERNFKKVEVVLWDERLSTSFATKVLYEGKVDKKDHKKVIDKMAAMYILQGYLDSIKNKV